ncbi:hypothetical protein E5288_WYG021921 [Bos mutus]|uniref:Aminopeptidase n=18 Tax=Amniota TaxID=32524 RepID=A0A6B0RXD0_9CETA|nr:hypothetical protein [Bos mutus]
MPVWGSGTERVAVRSSGSRRSSAFHRAFWKLSLDRCNLGDYGQSEDTQQQIIRETFHLVSKRDENVCNFLEGGLLIGGSDNKLIYRHYATLYFVFCVDSSESELGILDLIQVFVETLDKCFENVCELDLIFHVDKVHNILAEMVMGGMVLETNMNEIVTQIDAQNKLEKSEAGLAGAPARAVSAVKNMNLPEIPRNINIAAAHHVHVTVIICKRLIIGVVMMKVKRHLHHSSATTGPVTVMEGSRQIQQELCGESIQMFIKHPGQSEKEDVNGSKWTVTTFHTTPHMPTYLAAFVICDYEHIGRIERGKEIRIWARKDAIADGNADFALNITGPIFSFLEDLFNISYPLPKTDIIALPTFDNRAMENWGLLIFDESLLLLQPNDKLTEKKIMISYIVSHEIGHQAYCSFHPQLQKWFGNLVTMNWWNNIWLNEGFASYFEFGIVNHFNPKLPMNEIFFSNILHGVLREDHALVSRAVSMKVESFTETNEIDELFDLITYNKGASLARMLSSFLNEKIFISALKSYLETFSYSNAEQDDLWRHFQMAIDDQSKILLPATVKSIMDSWTHQSGFPVITLNVSTGVMKQEPFYLGKVKNQTLLTHNDTWIIPILWMKNGTTQSLVWLDKSSKVFPEMQISDSDHDWVILNLNMTGYYRVNYDKLGWKKLNQQLEKDHKAIPVIHRLQLVDDAFSLSKNDYIEIETALDLTKYLADEDEIIVWHAVLMNLVTRDLVSDGNNHDIYPLLKKYLLKRLISIWNTYSTMIRENVTALQEDYLALISLDKVFGTACLLGLEDCLQLSRELFRNWMNHPENEIPNPIKNVILCYGIALGNDKEWDFLLKIYNNNTEEEERIQLAYAMSCSKDPRILNRYMDYAITVSPFTFNETNVIEAVAASEVGRYVAKDFLINNWQAVSERYGTQSLVTLLYVIGRTISTDLQISELQQFCSNMLEEHQRLTVQAKLQTIKNENLKNKERSARIAAWLRKNT